MQSNYTLDDTMVDSMISLKELILGTNYWSDSVYLYILESIKRLRININFSYKNHTGQFIEESIRQMMDGTFQNDLSALTDHLNAYLFLYKLQFMINWHQRYHVFPDDIKIK